MNIPDIYQHIEYLDTDGNSWIDTGVLPTATTLQVDYKMQILQQEYVSLFGAVSSTTPRDGLRMFYQPTADPDKLHIQSSNFSVLQTFIWDAVLDGTLKVETQTRKVVSTTNGQTQTFFNSAVNLTLNNTILVGTTHLGTSISGKSPSRIWYLKITKEGVVVFNGIPCRRKYDSVLGMYDTVTGNFLTNQGTGTFIAGPNVNPTIKVYKKGYAYGEPKSNTVSAKPTDVVRIQATDYAPVKSMKGNTVKWNQLVSNGDFSNGTTGWSANNGSISMYGDKLKYVATTDQYNHNIYNSTIKVISGHKYYMVIDADYSNYVGAGVYIKSKTNNTMLLDRYGESGSTFLFTSSVTDQIYVRFRDNTDGLSNKYVLVKTIELIDLTAIFGAGNERATVADFETWLATNVGLKDYYPYDAGSLLSVNTPSTVINDNEYPFPITTLKDINGNVMFPNGLCKAGDVKDEIDFEHGIAVKRVGVVDLGTLNWVNSEGATYPYFMTNIGHVEKQNVKMECVLYNDVQITNTDQNIGINGFYNYNDGRGNVWLRCRDTSYANVTTFQTAMSGVYLYYELAEPVTYHFDTHVDLKKRYVPGICNAKGSTEVVGAGYISNHEFDNLTSNGVVIFPDGMNRTGNTYDEIYKDGNDWKAVVRTQVTKSGGIVSGITALAEPITYTIDASSIDMRAVSEVRKGDMKLWENKDGYGVKINTTTGACERIGNMEYHKTLPIQSRMRRCIVGSDDSVRYVHPDNYLVDTDGNAIDYTVTEANGVTYDVMVEIPEHYYDCYQVTEDGTDYDIIMLYPEVHKGKKVPLHYMGAFKAAVKRNVTDGTSTAANEKLFSTVKAGIVYNSSGGVNASDLTYTVADREYYRGGALDNAQSSWDNDKQKSLIGKPVTQRDISEFATMAKNRGSKYMMLHWAARNCLNRLFVVEYATLNSQDTFNSALDSNGYHQGGLGAGVSTVSDGGAWNTHNSYYPVIPCGVTLRLGNNTGVVQYNLSTGTAIGGISNFSIPSYRGVESPFGDIWEMCNGVYIYGADNKNYIYTAVDGWHQRDFLYNSSTTVKPGFKLKSNTVPIDTNSQSTTERYAGWITSWKWDSDGDFVPTGRSVGKSNTEDTNSPLRDYFWGQNTGVKRLVVGGALASPARAGLFAFHCANAVASRYASHGSRLLKVVG